MYLDGHGILREALAECARRAFSISDLNIKHEANGTSDGGRRHVTVELEVRGQGSVSELATELHELDGVLDVHAGDANETSY